MEKKWVEEKRNISLPLLQLFFPNISTTVTQCLDVIATDIVNARNTLCGFKGTDRATILWLNHH